MYLFSLLFLLSHIKGQKFMLRTLFTHPAKYIALLLAVVVFAGCSGKADHSDTIKKAMDEMKTEALALGTPKKVNDSLFFGDVKMNNNYELVDGLQEKYGCTATFFLKEGEEFVRISTDIIQDGQRAIGTILDPKGPVIENIRKGEPFYGVVDILGKDYETGYEPITNANDEIIGIYYVGYEIEE